LCVFFIITLNGRRAICPAKQKEAKGMGENPMPFASFTMVGNLTGY
jgi:hypothetical protein